MINRQAIKENAKFQLGNNLFGKVWLMAVLVCLIESAILSAASSMLPVASLILAGPLGVGVAFVFLGLANGRNEVKIEEVFTVGFSAQFGRNLLLGLLTSIFVALWSLLLVVPGIVKTYAYRFAPYIANDHPEYTWRQCLDESIKMTEGHKIDLFVLDLSFIGWYFVGSLCLGVGTLWVAAYHLTSLANYYEAVKGIPSVEVQ